MMIINVSQLLKEPIGSSRKYRVGEPDCAQFSGGVHLVRTDCGILVSGLLETRDEMVCSRCLQSFGQELKFKLEEEYLLYPEEGDFAINEYREIDLSDALRQYTLLTEPMKPLCCEDCAGLCPQCGKNLNLGRCGCTEEIDPRLAVLVSLAKDR